MSLGNSSYGTWETTNVAANQPMFFEVGRWFYSVCDCGVNRWWYQSVGVTYSIPYECRCPWWTRLARRVRHGF